MDHGGIVVNCFQISTLLVESQLRDLALDYEWCCELLSNQYFTSRITAYVRVSFVYGRL